MLCALQAVIYPGLSFNLFIRVFWTATEHIDRPFVRVCTSCEHLYVSCGIILYSLSWISELFCLHVPASPFFCNFNGLQPVFFLYPNYITPFHIFSYSSSLHISCTRFAGNDPYISSYDVLLGHHKDEAEEDGRAQHADGAHQRIGSLGPLAAQSCGGRPDDHA